MHRINVAVLMILLMSGLQIFNAHPSLDWRKSSYSGRPPVLQFGSFPSWMTIPGSQWLAMARRWHFFFAWMFVVNGALYIAYSAWSRHLERDLTPTRLDWRSLGRSIIDHVRFRHPVGEMARRYNVPQKITYLFVIVHVFEVVVTGLWNNMRSMITGRFEIKAGDGVERPR